MLHSMTGHGQALVEHNGCAVHVELRCVNGRYFKLNLRAADGQGWLEQRVETLLRNFVQRGTVQMTLRIAGTQSEITHGINVSLIHYYAGQVGKLTAELGLEPGTTIVELMQLPGAIVEMPGTSDDERLVWPVVEAATREAAHNLNQMRGSEGSAMAADFVANLGSLGQFADRIRQKAPTVTQEYRDRLADRLLQLQSDRNPLDPHDLAREVALFADRCDISEELVRLDSHIRQFREVLDDESPAGKKLEFIIQEMFREINTIGSKANDLTISRNVIELKTIIERMREMVQNVE